MKDFKYKYFECIFNNEYSLSYKIYWGGNWCCEVFIYPIELITHINLTFNSIFVYDEYTFKDLLECIDECKKHLKNI